MANTQHICDAVVHNILARLPGKPLLRFLCVSKHWNGLILDPCFMKSRSRQMILIVFSCPRPLVVIDDNLPTEDNARSIFRIPSPVKEYLRKVSIIGTFNGIVLLALIDNSLRCQLVLHNLLTCASKTLVEMHSRLDRFTYVFGFGYDETARDLKIVRLEHISSTKQFKKFQCDIYDLKTNSWASPPQYIVWDSYLSDDVGVFLNDFLYWATHKYLNNGILALNVKEMVFSKIRLPDGLENIPPLSESISGCLCVINIIKKTRFDVWLMKEQGNENSWMKAHSFTFSLDLGGGLGMVVYPICILSNGKILMAAGSHVLVIYDTSNHSYKILESLESFNDLQCVRSMNSNLPMEYVESLVSPSDLCFI
ncbi:F-box protein At3g07870-like [Bidens hawaiensis]|uniref:F-box protein At3g07870-like n=1 Tax=Bidens hawaiensis TaxID=980011 RepID=UPI004049E2C8